MPLSPTHGPPGKPISCPGCFRFSFLTCLPTLPHVCLPSTHSNPSTLQTSHVPAPFCPIHLSVHLPIHPSIYLCAYMFMRVLTYICMKAKGQPWVVFFRCCLTFVGFLYNFQFCVCVVRTWYLHVNVWCVYLWAHVWRPEEGAFLYHILHYCLETRYLIGQRLTVWLSSKLSGCSLPWSSPILGWLTRTPGISVSLTLRLHVHTIMPYF